jgi:hypothetical protein
MNSRRVANIVLAMVLLSFFAAIAYLAVSPWYLFGLGQPPILRLGYVTSKEGPSWERLHASVEAAVEDINHSVRTLSPRPPSVLLESASAESDSIWMQFERLYNKEHVRVFMVVSEDDLQALQLYIADNDKHYEAATFVTLASVLDNGIQPPAASHRLISTNIDLKEEVRGYLAIMNSNNPTNKTLDIVAVWENVASAHQYYGLIIAEAEENYPNLKFTLPVTYEASQYPKSDAIQAASEIGSRLVLHPDAHIFFLTSSRLREVIDVAHMNKDLTNSGRRWYARNIHDLDFEVVEDFCIRTSLTTLTFMASVESDEAVELLRRSMGHANTSSSLSSSQVYLEALAYSTVNDLHVAFTKSQIDMRSVGRIMQAVRRTSDTEAVAASLTYYGKLPSILPLANWMVTDLIYFPAEKVHQPRVETVHTHPLAKSELEALLAETTALGRGQCKQPGIKLWLHPSIILPHFSLNYESLADFPEMLILPAQKGISVSLKCGLASSITAHCVPRKFNQGDLTCQLSTTWPVASMIEESDIKRRSVEDDENSSTSLFSLKTLLSEFNKKIRPIWSSLTPDVFSCSASIAGCDFCFYYLATYNLSVAPAACVGGCSLGTFGSCSKLVGTSLVETFDLRKPFE